MITVICGTNRRNSKTKIIASLYYQLLSSKGEKVNMLDLGDISFNFVDSDLYKNPEKHAEIVAYRKIIEASVAIFTSNYLT